MGEKIVAIICGLIAAGCALNSVLSFKNKGFLFNNAYIWATQEEREKLDKKPHYRQTAVVFAIIAGIFVCLALQCLFKHKIFKIIEWLLIAAVFVYAIVSSIMIEKNKDK